MGARPPTKWMWKGGIHPVSVSCALPPPLHPSKICHCLLINFPPRLVCPNSLEGIYPKVEGGRWGGGKEDERKENGEVLGAAAGQAPVRSVRLMEGFNDWMRCVEGLTRWDGLNGCGLVFGIWGGGAVLYQHYHIVVVVVVVAVVVVVPAFFCWRWCLCTLIIKHFLINFLGSWWWCDDERLVQ